MSRIAPVILPQQQGQDNIEKHNEEGWRMAAKNTTSKLVDEPRKQNEPKDFPKPAGRAALMPHLRSCAIIMQPID
jgi:hypothetical protein